MYSEKPVPVGNILPLRFVVGNKNKVIKGFTKGAWDTEISVAVIMSAGVPVKEVLENIDINSSKVVVHIERDCGA